MARPVKEVRLQVNQLSVQVWRKGVYVGSVPLRELYVLAEKNRNKRTGVVNVQEFDEQEEPESGG